MEMKVCTKCGEEKALVDFEKDCSKKSGRSSRCKVCSKEYQSKYRLENAEKVKALRRKWHLRYIRNQKNVEKEKARLLRYYARNAATLSPQYIAKNILQIPLSDCPPELIELKRQQLQLYRVTKQLKKELRK